jgi:putative tryptophan/tyrosine transport system substrate-binding protein
VSGELLGVREKMKKAIFYVALCPVLLALCSPVVAQQPKKISRIGLLFAATPSANSERLKAFRQGLRERGYVEEKDILIEQRYAEGNLDVIPALAADLVHLKVDVIISASSTGTRSLKEATNTIPIVMAQDTDPVGNKFVASLARPGGNITGLCVLAPELGGKRLELLKEIVPKLSRLAVLGTSTNATTARVLKEMELAAAALKVQLQYQDVEGPKDIETAFRDATKGRAEGMLLLNSGVLNSQRKQLINLAIRSRLPGIYFASEWVEDGGLVSYGVSYTDLYRRAATYVDKILKGAKPADLPVEQPTKFEFVINLKAAKQIGLTIPPNVLARADKVIK